MAKTQKAEAAAVDAPERHPHTVLVLAGYDEAGNVLTRDAVADEGATPRQREVTIGGEAYEHVADAADGTWVYAHSHAKRR